MNNMLIVLVRICRVLIAVVLGSSWGGLAYAEGQAAVASTDKVEVSTATGQSNQSDKPDTVLQQRIDTYWAARQSRDITTVYQLESAAQPGGWLKLENAMSLAGLPIRKVKIEGLQIEGDRANVKITAEVNIGTLGWMPQSIQDNWILLSGQWFHETVR
jgi:hypothetical protein